MVIFLLVDVEDGGSISELLEELRAVPEVKTAEAVKGLYDIVVRLEGDEGSIKRFSYIFGARVLSVRTLDVVPSDAKRGEKRTCSNGV